MGVYITTSKNPSEKTREFCRILSSILPRSVYESRGKKSIEQIFRRAKLLGKSRALLVYERKGDPAKICFMKIKAHSWEWIGGEINMVKFRVGRIPKKLPDELMAEGKLDVLFDFGKPEGDDFITCELNSKRIVFSYKKPLLELLLCKQF